MKAISLWQPWASLWLSPRKIHETRHWAIKHRGDLAIHAAKRIVKDVDPALREILVDEFGGHWAMDLPKGAIIGVVQIVDCIRTETATRYANADDLACGDYSADRFAWERGEFRLLSRPIPYTGRQGLFTISDEVLR